MDILEKLSDIIWGLPTALLILSLGIWLTVKFRAPQLREVGGMFRAFGGGKSDGKNLSASQSLASALAATVGTGSVIGVASAITAGGAGAIFWLWVSAFFGMAIAKAEGELSIIYREETGGKRRGGIWYALRDGLHKPHLAKIYAFLCVGASFGMGCAVQTNSAAEAMEDGFGLRPELCGIVLAAILFLCLIGQGFAGRLCEKAVPFMAGLYILGAMIIILRNCEKLPAVFSEIFSEAMGLRQAASGFSGYALSRALSVGCRRGIFSNEAGLGTTAPLHGSSQNDSPKVQGQMNMLEVVIDSFVICTLTALAILTSGANLSLEGSSLVTAAAQSVFGKTAVRLVPLCISLFAAATAVGWSQIGLSAAEYAAPKLTTLYRAAFIFCAFAGSVMSLKAAWTLSDIFNGLMAFPCIYAVFLLFRRQSFPEEPKPAVPLSESGRESDSAISGNITGRVTS